MTRCGGLVELWQVTICQARADNSPFRNQALQTSASPRQPPTTPASSGQHPRPPSRPSLAPGDAPFRSEPPTFVSPGQCRIRNGVLPVLHQATKENRSIEEGSSPCLLVPINFSHHGKDPPLKASPFVSRFSRPHPPVALRRLGRAGRDAGEPGPASGVAAPRTQRGPGHGGRPPVPQSASEPACGSPPAAL